MNPPMAHPTRLRIRNHAKLILEPNTVILTGGYLAIWPGQELRLGADTYLAHGVSINTRCGLRIGSNVMIGHETTIMDYDGHPVFPHWMNHPRMQIPMVELHRQFQLKIMSG